MLGSDFKNDDVTKQAYHAIRGRLEFRKSFLLAMATDEDTDSVRRHWLDTVPPLGRIKNSHQVAKPVPESFSAKIQRRLASTVPPKPMVELSFNDAFQKLAQLQKDCLEAVRIVEFGTENVQRLKVGGAMFLKRRKH